MVSISYKLSITWIAEIIRTHFGQVNMHFVAADRLRQEIERQHCGRIYNIYNACQGVTYQLHETAGELLKVTSFRIALAEVARPRFNRFRPEEQKTPNSISKQM